MLKATVSAIALTVGLGAAHAAKIHSEKDEKGYNYIILEGDIKDGDRANFDKELDALPEKGSSVLMLDSPGGLVSEAFDIANDVRVSGIKTAVPPGASCVSACAFIWIVGGQRIAADDAKIGFHGPFDISTGQGDGMTNAYLGMLFGYVGLSYDALDWMLSPKPTDMHWLTKDIAQQFNMNVKWIADKSAASSTEKHADGHYTLRVTRNTYLRAEPYLNADNVLQKWKPNNYVPEGTLFTGDGEPPCEGTDICWYSLTYKHDGVSTKGYLSSRYLEIVGE